ncbi:MAG: hypothetical protein IPG05_04460 [Gemmatimonadetes bacterium]|nr:hypothetical protein [Gemmatimonadota bacterium]
MKSTVELTDDAVTDAACTPRIRTPALMLSASSRPSTSTFSSETTPATALIESDAPL